jgi:hypothetical protein
MSILDKTIDIIKKIKEMKTATIQFIKKDGTERKMKCTLDFNQIPKEDKPKKIEITSILSMAKKGQMHVYDLEKKGWRVVSCQKLKFLEEDK